MKVYNYRVRVTSLHMEFDIIRASTAKRAKDIAWDNVKHSSLFAFKDESDFMRKATATRI